MPCYQWLPVHTIVIHRPIWMLTEWSANYKTEVEQRVSQETKWTLKEKKNSKKFQIRILHFATRLFLIQYFIITNCYGGIQKCRNFLQTIDTFLYKLNSKPLPLIITNCYGGFQKCLNFYKIDTIKSIKLKTSPSFLIKLFTAQLPELDITANLNKSNLEY